MVKGTAMEEIKRILAAICFSDYCPATFELAASLARKYKARLIVVNVINDRELSAVSSIESMGYEVHVSAYLDEVEKERMQELKQMIRQVDFPKQEVKIIFRVGHPFNELMEVIEDEDIDMVIVGAKGRSDIPHALIGSVSERLFRHCPVTVVSHRNRLRSRQTGNRTA